MFCQTQTLQDVISHIVDDNEHAMGAINDAEVQKSLGGFFPFTSNIGFEAWLNRGQKPYVRSTRPDRFPLSRNFGCSPSPLGT